MTSPSCHSIRGCQLVTDELLKDAVSTAWSDTQSMSVSKLHKYRQAFCKQRLFAKILGRKELTIQGVLQQYEEGPDKLVRFCHAWDALLLCVGLQAIALVLIWAKCRVYDVQLPFACLTHHSDQLYTVHLQVKGMVFWLLVSAHSQYAAPIAWLLRQLTMLVSWFMLSS